MLNAEKSRLVSGKTLLLISFLFFVTYNAYSQNTKLGNQSLYSNTTGTHNTAIGKKSLYFNTTGKYNTALGNKSLYSNITGDNNTALGYQSLYSNTVSNNTAIGYNSLYSNTTGLHNTALGNQSLYSNTVGHHNTAIGKKTLFSNIDGKYNTAVGHKSLYSNTTGHHNTAMGYQSLYSNTKGSWSTSIGNYSLRNSIGPGSNVAIGNYSLLHNDTGFYNTAVGDSALLQNNWHRNTAIGYKAGYNLSRGRNNIFIGFESCPSSGSVSNEITLGNNLIASLRCNVTAITSLSDARDKKNISDLTLGLDFITKLKPRQYKWDRREWYEDNKSDGSKMEEKLNAGFIAQELDEVQQSEDAEWLDLVYKSNPEKLETTTGNLLPVMVKAIQELKDKNETLEEEIIQLKKEIESLKYVNDKFVQLEKLIKETKTNEEEIKEIKSSSN